MHWDISNSLWPLGSQANSWEEVKVLKHFLVFNLSILAYGFTRALSEVTFPYLRSDAYLWRVFMEVIPMHILRLKSVLTKLLKCNVWTQVFKLIYGLYTPPFCGIYANLIRLIWNFYGSLLFWIGGIFFQEIFVALLRLKFGHTWRPILTPNIVYVCRLSNCSTIFLTKG